jgi:putative hydrolase of the HAD superfamily
MTIGQDSEMFFKIKVIFFDIGGVVVDADLQAYDRIGARLFGTEPELIRKAAAHLVPDLECGRMSSHNFWKLIETSLWSLGQGRPNQTTDLASLWENILSESIKVNQEVLLLARELSVKHRVGVLSNVIKDHAVALSRMKVYDGFDPLLVSCQVGLRKPDPAFYKLAAKEAGVWCRQCLFIDDLEENCRAAQAVGMKTLVFKGAASLRADLVRLKLL